MRAYLQPSFGFPSELIPVAYVIVILSNGEHFKILESDGELYINPIKEKDDITDNEQ